MEKFIFYPVAFVIGMLLSLHLAMSSAAGSILKSMPSANLIFWTAGVLSTFAVWLVSPGKDALQHVREVPAYLFLAGVLGAIVITYGMISLIPKLGAGPTMVVVIAGQTAAALAISHYGILGTLKEPVTALKILGVVLVIAGASLTTLKGSSAP